jgi:hypothetical protein
MIVQPIFVIETVILRTIFPEEFDEFGLCLWGVRKVDLTTLELGWRQHNHFLKITDDSW